MVGSPFLLDSLVLLVPCFATVQTIMEIETLIKLGQSLGYEKDELRVFVKEQTEWANAKEKDRLEREERASEQEMKKNRTGGEKGEKEVRMGTRERKIRIGERKM